MLQSTDRHNIYLLRSTTIESLGNFHKQCWRSITQRSFSLTLPFFLRMNAQKLITLQTPQGIDLTQGLASTSRGHLSHTSSGSHVWTYVQTAHIQTLTGTDTTPKPQAHTAVRLHFEAIGMKLCIYEEYGFSFWEHTKINFIPIKNSFCNGLAVQSPNSAPVSEL